MKTLLAWIPIVVSNAISAAYLTWIAYGPAAAQDGTLSKVLTLAMKWYGIPAAIMVQLLIWWTMPRLFALAPSPWIAALIWPLFSQITKIVVLWNTKAPDTSDIVVIVGSTVTLLVAALIK